MSKKLCLIVLCVILLLETCGCENNSIGKNNFNEKKENIEVNEDIDNKQDENNINEDVNVKENEKTEPTTPNNNTNNQTNNNTNDKNDSNKTNNDNTNNNNNIDNNDNINNNNSNDNNKVELTQEEITITNSNLFEYFEIKRLDIIPELNAFGERGTEEDFYYELVLSLKNIYKQKLIASNISVEFTSETYLRSFSYNRQTGLGTITNEYRNFYNNTDRFLCNIKNSSSCHITMCHIAGSTYINEKLVYYAYITEKLEPVRVGGSIILKK